MKSIFLTLFLLSTLFSAQITDMYSRNINLPEKINKIIAIGPGALRLITILGADDKIVGIEKVEHSAINFSEYRTILGEKRIKSLPIIGAGGANKLPNLEVLMQLNPDLIIASFIDTKQLNLITKKTGIPTFALSYGKGYGGNSTKNEAVKKSLLLLGQILNKQERAKEVTQFMTLQENELIKYPLKDQKIYIGGIGFKGVHGITSTEKHYPSFELLGLTNILAKNAKSNHVTIQEESLLLENPDFIFLDLLGEKIIKENFDKKLNLYKSLKAHKNNNITWLLPYNFYNTNISNVYINSWIILSKLGYDIDIRSKMSLIYNAFYKNEVDKLITTRYPLKKF